MELLPSHTLDALDSSPLCFSTDSSSTNLLAYLAPNNTLSLFNFRDSTSSSASASPTYAPDDSPQSNLNTSTICFSPDLSTVALCSSGSLSIYSTADLSPVFSTVLGTGITSSHFSKNGQRISVVIKDSLHVIDLNKADPLASTKIPEDKVLLVSPFLLGDGSVALCYDPSGGNNSDGGLNLCLMNTEDLRKLCSLTDYAPSPQCCCLSPNNQRVATWKNDSLSLWDTSTGKVIKSPSGLRQRRASSASSSPVVSITACSFSPNSSKFVTGTSSSELFLWSSEDGSLISKLQLPCGGAVLSCSLLADDSVVVSVAKQPGLQVWNVQSATLISLLASHSFPENFITSLSGDRVAARSGSKIQIWTLNSPGDKQLVLDAEKLREALHQPDPALKTDEAEVVAIFASRSRLQITCIAHIYQQLFKSKLEKDLEMRMTSNNLARLLSGIITPVPDYLAYCVFTSLDGAITHDSDLIDILCQSDANRMSQIRLGWAKRYQEERGTLEQYVLRNTKFDFKKLMQQLLVRERKRPGAVDMGIIQTQAQLVMAAQSLSSEDVLRVFTGSSAEHLQILSDAIRELGGEPLGTIIRARATGSFALALECLMTPRAEWVVRRIRDALRGGGDSLLLISRLFLTCQDAMGDAGLFYQQTYGTAMMDDLEQLLSSTGHQLQLQLLCSFFPSN